MMNKTTYLALGLTLALWGCDSGTGATSGEEMALSQSDGNVEEAVQEGTPDESLDEGDADGALENPIPVSEDSQLAEDSESSREEAVALQEEEYPEEAEGGEEESAALPMESWGEDLCLSDTEKGFSIGDVLSPLDFKTCGGDTYSTKNLCGASATWIYIVHAWCGECRQLSAEMEEIASDYQDAGVATVQLLVHSYEHQLPNSDDCAAWSEEFGLSDTLMLFDPLVKNIMLQESQQTGLSVFLDGDQRIVAKEHFYDAQSIRSILDELLEPTD